MCLGILPGRLHCSSLEVWLVGRLPLCPCFQASRRRPPQHVLCEESRGWGLPDRIASVVEKKLFDTVDAGLPALVSLVYEYLHSCTAKAQRGLSDMYTSDLNIRTRAPSSNHDLVVMRCCDFMRVRWLRIFSQVHTAVPLLSHAHRPGHGGGGPLARGSSSACGSALTQSESDSNMRSC